MVLTNCFLIIIDLYFFLHTSSLAYCDYGKCKINLAQINSLKYKLVTITVECSHLCSENEIFYNENLVLQEELTHPYQTQASEGTTFKEAYATLEEKVDKLDEEATQRNIFVGHSRIQ